MASDWKFGLSGIFQPLRITSGGCIAYESIPTNAFTIASDWKFGLSGIFQPLRITSGGCKSVVCNSTFLHTPIPENVVPCAIPRFCTPQDPKPSFRVQFCVFTHREACRMSATEHPNGSSD